MLSLVYEGTSPSRGGDEEVARAVSGSVQVTPIN